MYNYYLYITEGLSQPFQLKIQLIFLISYVKTQRSKIYIFFKKQTNGLFTGIVLLIRSWLEPVRYQEETMSPTVLRISLFLQIQIKVVFFRLGIIRNPLQISVVWLVSLSVIQYQPRNPRCQGYYILPPNKFIPNLEEEKFQALCALVQTSQILEMKLILVLFGI